MKTCVKCGAEGPAEEFTGRKCKPCMAAYKRAWYERNREAALARQAAWHRANPERTRAAKKRWRDKQDPAARRLAERKYLSDPAVRDARNKRLAKWRKANPDVVSLNAWRSNTRRRSGFRVSHLKPWVAVLYRDPCSYCGGPGGEIDHIVPVTANGETTESNLVSACRSCNAAKNNKALLRYLLDEAQSSDLSNAA